MQKAHDIDLFLSVFIVPVSFGDLPGICPNPFGMAVRIGILGIYRLCQRMHNMKGQAFQFGRRFCDFAMKVSLQTDQVNKVSYPDL